MHVAVVVLELGMGSKPRRRGLEVQVTGRGNCNE